jgi:hypothetical protein
VFFRVFSDASSDTHLRSHETQSQARVVCRRTRSKRHSTNSQAFDACRAIPQHGMIAPHLRNHLARGRASDTLDLPDFAMVSRPTHSKTKSAPSLHFCIKNQRFCSGSPLFLHVFSTKNAHRFCSDSQKFRHIKQNQPTKTKNQPQLTTNPEDWSYPQRTGQTFYLDFRIYRMARIPQSSDKARRGLTNKGAPNKEKSPILERMGLQEYAGDHLISHTLTRAVPSAQRGLTSVFGMGTGVTLAVNSPAKF